VELPDIVSLGKPSRFELPSRQPWPLAITFGRYDLLVRIPSGPDDECYWSRIRGPAGFEKVVFVRRFAEERLDDDTIEAIKRQAIVSTSGVSQVFELGRQDGWGFVVGDIVVGASIAALLRAGRRVPWLVALAIVFDTCRRLVSVYERYREHDIDLALTPARIVLSTTGVVTLCMGIPAPRRATWHRTLCDVIHPILSLAATADERVLLRELFTDDNPEGVWVASDALVQQHPELDPVLPIVFLALAGRVPHTAAHAALVERVPIEQLRALWRVVVDTAAQRAP